MCWFSQEELDREDGRPTQIERLQKAIEQRDAAIAEQREAILYLRAEIREQHEALTVLARAAADALAEAEASEGAVCQTRCVSPCRCGEKINAIRDAIEKNPLAAAAVKEAGR